MVLTFIIQIQVIIKKEEQVLDDVFKGVNVAGE